MASASEKGSYKVLDERLKLYSVDLNTLLFGVMLRRTGESKFFEYTIIDLDLMIIHEIPCQTKEQYTASIKKYADKTKKELQLKYKAKMKQWKA